MKVAIVHDFLMQMGGAEKVVEVLHDMFPDAPIYTSAYDARAMPAHYREWDIRTSFLQRLWLKKKLHRLALPFYPAAFESFNLSGFDVVISSSSAFAKGIITQPGTAHICYNYTPMRYAWATSTYVENERIPRPLRALLSPALHYLRTWDTLTIDRVDQYVAISGAVSQRIEKFYRRDCHIIHPPVETARYQIASTTGDYYFIASRFVPYKRLDLAVEAFTRLNRPLKIAGDGRQMKALRAKAGPNVEFLGRVPNDELEYLMAHCHAYVMPGEEDFGLAPVEANACGRPVIAYGAGGVLDTQRHGHTGVLFFEQTVEALCAAVERADHVDFDPAAIRAHALQFDTAIFREKIHHLVREARIPHQRKGDRRIGDRRKGGDQRQKDLPWPAAQERRVADRRHGERRTTAHERRDQNPPALPKLYDLNGYLHDTEHNAPKDAAEKTTVRGTGTEL